MLDVKHIRSDNRGMNKLPLAKRVQILSMLVEGSSCRSISRVADVSLNTVYKTLIDAGKACARFHDKAVRNVASKRVQCDEAWSFCYAKAKNVATAKAAPQGAGLRYQADPDVERRRTRRGIRAGVDGRSARAVGEPGAADDRRASGSPS